ncbi:MAG: hypothetical protein NPIRA02_06140 [Nitrospirales bacterium]|nr:MAG: hypothetical protein NPIRA02_06140 [Nitrospirales bacterium]
MGKGNMHIHDTDDLPLVVIGRGVEEAQIESIKYAERRSRTKPSLKPLNASNNSIHHGKAEGIVTSVLAESEPVRFPSEDYTGGYESRINSNNQKDTTVKMTSKIVSNSIQ